MRLDEQQARNWQHKLRRFLVWYTTAPVISMTAMIKHANIFCISSTSFGKLLHREYSDEAFLPWILPVYTHIVWLYMMFVWKALWHLPTSCKMISITLHVKWYPLIRRDHFSPMLSHKPSITRLSGRGMGCYFMFWALIQRKHVLPV